MPYDASWAGLLSPGKGEPLDPAQFAGNEDALCAELSRLAYFDFTARRDDLAKALADHGLTLAATFQRRAMFVDSEAMIAVAADGTHYVAFRGTQNALDLLTDLIAVPVCWKSGGLVHWGFKKAWAALQTDVAGWFAQHQPRRIVATGHSLGGALAVLFAADYPAAELVTFGCPLVGNGEFAGLFAGRSVRRYRHCCDLVPRVPPDWAIYRQLAGLRYIDHTGGMHDQPDRATATRDMQLGRAAFRRAKLGGVPVRQLADHAPLNYVWALLGELTPP